MTLKNYDIAELRRLDVAHHLPAQQDYALMRDLGGSRNSGYPRLARRGTELIFAWTGTGDRLRVETAIARLP